MNAHVRAVGIASLADWLHAGAAKSKALVLMKAYFDESGTDGESLITVIAGYVASKDVWTEVEAKWKAELDVYADKGVKTFRMTDCIAQVGEFARLDKFFSSALIQKLSEVLRDHDVHAIWSAVSSEAWKTVTDTAFLAAYPKPFDLCFDHVVRQLWRWAKTNAGGEIVVPMFAYQPEYYSRMAEVGRVYGSRASYREVLGPIAFGYPFQVVPLQTADFVAHPIRKEFEHVEYDELTLDNIDRALALKNATAFNGMGVGGGFDARALAATVERFKKTGNI